MALLPALDWTLSRLGFAMTPRAVWRWLPIVVVCGILAVSFVSGFVG